MTSGRIRMRRRKLVLETLEKYAEHFDNAYLNYGDVRYLEIRQLVEGFDAADTIEYVQGNAFAKAVGLIKPMAAIKNYKSQVPFPEDIATATMCIAKIRNTAVDGDDVLRHHRGLIEQLLGQQGFQLPTISAVLHFCHPNHFPIVDVNVQAACALLKARNEADFIELTAPKIPAGSTSTKNQLRKYGAFITFINRIVQLQGAHCMGVPNYRYIDKALMVLGVPQLRREVEGIG